MSAQRPVSDDDNRPMADVGKVRFRDASRNDRMRNLSEPAKACAFRGGVAMSRMLRAPALAKLVLLIALLVAVSVRLLCPPGWMANPDQRLGSVLVICTGNGPRTIDLDDHHAPAPVDGKTQHHACMFSGTTLAEAPAAILVASAAEHPVAAALSFPPGQPAIAPSRRRAQAARAPPLTV
jgi:hypothetical protein